MMEAEEEIEIPFDGGDQLEIPEKTLKISEEKMACIKIRVEEEEEEEDDKRVDTETSL